MGGEWNDSNGKYENTGKFTVLKTIVYPTG